MLIASARARDAEVGLTWRDDDEDEGDGEGEGDSPLELEVEAVEEDLGAGVRGRVLAEGGGP